MDFSGFVNNHFLDSLSESIALVSSNKKEVVYLNQALRTYLDLQQQFSAANSIFELVRAINPVNINSLLTFINNKLNEESSEFRYIFKSIKKNQIVNTNLSIFKSEMKNHYFLFFSFHNLSHKNNSFANQDLFVAEYSQIAEQFSEWVWEVDSECRYVKSNFAVYDLLGYYPDEIFGKTPFEIMPLKESERVRELFLSIEKSKANINKLINTNISKSGKLIQLETNGMPIFDEIGNYNGYRGIDYINFNNVMIDKTRTHYTRQTKIEENQKKINILVIDDRRLTSDLLSESFIDSENYTLNTISSVDVGDINSIIKKHSPDVILVFINLPDYSGLKILDGITAKHKQIKLVAITECSKPFIINKINQVGVHGCITMFSSIEELIICIRQVIDGEKYYCETTQKVIASFKSHSLNTSFLAAFEQLTSREKEILRLIALQMTTAEIAEKLCISIRTAETHRKHLLKKLCVKNSVGLIKLAIDNNFIEIS